VKIGSDLPDNIEYLKFLEREKKFSDSIMNHSKSMISIINRNYKYEKVNLAFCNAHQQVMDSIVGKSLAEVWGADNFRENIKRNVDQCFSGKMVRYEASFSTPKSGNRYYEVVFRPFSARGDEITHLIAETFDITDLKLSQKATNEIQEQFRMFETNLPIGFLRCDPDGKIINANEAFLRIMEIVDNKSITSKNLKDFYSEQDLFNLHFDQLIIEKTRSFGRVEFITSNGQHLLCRVSGFMAQCNLGNPTFADFAFEDMSRELLLENRLMQAQKLESIGVLAGGIAHDFNNILATISGYSEMLKDDLIKSPDSHEKVNKIMLAVSRARSLTNQILTFSRQVEQEKVPVNVADILIETIGFVRSALPSDISIKDNISSKSATVFADPTQLFRVFLNLMTNAVQAMEEGGGVLTVNTEIVDGKHLKHELSKVIVADEYIIVSFEDTGKGMDPSLVQRIFEPFYTTREVGKGYGLGLSVVHGIVAEMEGEILVSSNKQKGSVFYVYLPLSRELQGIPSGKENMKRILFLAGNKYESRILSIALESAGYNLIYASDHKRLIKILTDASLQPDLILYMSDSEKINIQYLIGMFCRLKLTIPCVMIANTEKDLSDEKLVNSGIINQYLIKPVSLKEIKNTIQLSLK
jgi:PAS domain S-box-containing protein